MSGLIKNIIFVLFAFASSAHAALDIELTQGLAGAIPVAVVPFATQNSSLDEISPIVARNLHNSGKFTAMAADDMERLPHAAKDVDFKYWRENKIDYLIVGNVDKQADGKYKISYSLLDIYGSKVLLNKQNTINPKQSRSFAHHVSDLIYKKLTGQNGIFSSKIAYILVERTRQGTRHTLEIADADGYNPQQLLVSREPIMSPAWSPDRKEIAYVSFEHKRAAIYVQDVATGKRQKISSFPGINGAPAWSPDGKQMAVVLTKTGYPKIYLLDLATKKLQRLTDGWSLDTEPAWSPDGKSLIFTSNRGGGPQIYRLDLANHKINRITFDGNYNARASFTPNGKSIAMIHREGDMYTIALQYLMNGNLVLLAKSDLNESPSVAPNGEMIIYATNYEGKRELAEISIDGSIQLLLPTKSGEVQDPAWG